MYYVVSTISGPEGPYFSAVELFASLFQAQEEMRRIRSAVNDWLPSPDPLKHMSRYISRPSGTSEDVQLFDETEYRHWEILVESTVDLGEPN